MSDEAESPCPERLRAIDAVLEELVTPRGAGAAPPPSAPPPPPRALAHPARASRPPRGAAPLARRCLSLGDPPALSDEGGPAEAGLQEPLPGGATSCGSVPAPGTAAAPYEGAERGSTPSLLRSERPEGSPPPTASPSPSLFGAGVQFPMAALDFDLCPAFGPAVGLSRQQRLGRARALGLDPPTLAGGEGILRGCAWEGLL